MDDRDLELRRIELAEKEFELKREELALRREEGRWKATLLSPLGVAALGGVLTLLTALVGNLIQGRNSATVEQQRQQAQLILKAIDTGGDNDKARENLQFFVKAGLIDDDGTIAALVEEALQGNAVIPSIGPAAGPRENEVRYFIEDLPEIPDADDDAELVASALALWQRAARIPGRRVDSRDLANVVVVRAKEPGVLAYAFLGPPTQNTKLEIHVSHEHEWTAEDFQKTMCREFGHILGLTNTTTAGQLLSATTMDKIPSEPQSEDIERVRALWEPIAKPAG
jgi:hypothetical protein